jgi:protoporphyrinogen oxidase
MWNDILGADFLVRPRLSRILHQGYFFDYPLKPVNALKGLGFLEAIRIFLSYAKVHIFPNPEEKSFEDWVVNHFGYRLFDIFFKTYTEKVWGIPCSEISANWAAQRIKNLSLWEAVRNALGNDGKCSDGEIIPTLIERFHYPRFGPGMMWERCAEKLAEKGNPVLRGVRVQSIRRRKNRIESVFAQNNSLGLIEFGGDQFISSMPLGELVLALDPPPPEKVLNAARNLRHRDFLTVALIVKREDAFPDNWIYVHETQVKVGRIQNYKNWSSFMVTAPSVSSLGLEYFLQTEDPEWNWQDERLIDRGIGECSRIGIINPGEVIDGAVVRAPKAYPVYDRSYIINKSIIREYLSGFTNLQSIGRNGLHRYDNQDHAMLTGIYAARNILGEEYDVWSVNTDCSHHEFGQAENLPHFRPCGAEPDRAPGAGQYEIQ